MRDQRIRSLIQKAVRRGAGEVVDQAAERLVELGDSDWLDTRSFVIAFEECWPSASEILGNRSTHGLTAALRCISTKKKNKDAAGLGSLAFAVADGDRTALQAVESDYEVRIVVNAFRRPGAFFSWARKNMRDDLSMRILEAAVYSYPRATWPWDKTCILAAVFLATKLGVSELKETPSILDLPYWVALDKHTEQGRRAIKAISREMKIGYAQLSWTSFYFESALTNEWSNSPWWESEKKWRLSRAGISISEASDIWHKARSRIEETLKDEADNLAQQVQLRGSADMDLLG